MGIFTEALDALKSSSFPPRSYPALMANMDVETGGTYDYQQKQSKGNGYGLFQFDAQKKPYFDFLNDRGLQDSAQSQVQFAYDSIYSPKPFYDIGAGHRNKLRTSFSNDDVLGMTQQFMSRFERPGVPHEDRRAKSAQEWKQQLMPFDVLDTEGTSGLTGD